MKLGWFIVFILFIVIGILEYNKSKEGFLYCMDKAGHEYKAYKYERINEDANVRTTK